MCREEDLSWALLNSGGENLHPCTHLWKDISAKLHLCANECVFSQYLFELQMSQNYHTEQIVFACYINFLTFYAKTLSYMPCQYRGTIFTKDYLEESASYFTNNYSMQIADTFARLSVILGQKSLMWSMLDFTNVLISEMIWWYWPMLQLLCGVWYLCVKLYI